jgi:hypothetical protein
VIPSHRLPTGRHCCFRGDVYGLTELDLLLASLLPVGEKRIGERFVLKPVPRQLRPTKQRPRIFLVWQAVEKRR